MYRSAVNYSSTDRADTEIAKDGGGVRGLSSLIILQEVMGRVEKMKAGVKVHPHEHFDLIAGTGTGGIIACMLGRLRMPVEGARLEYAKLAESVFNDKKWISTTMYKGTKLQEALRKLVRGATEDEGAMMNEGREGSACKTVVFAMAKHNLNAGLPVLFRSYTVITNPGPNCTIRDALYATMAHPELFKGIDIVDSSVSQSFVGGELGCSNPLAHVLAEVQRIYPDHQIASIISIGAGHARTIQVPSPSRWYRTQDVTVMEGMAADSERVAEEIASRFHDTSGVYFRFNVDQGMQDMKAGSWKKMGEAMQHTRAYLQRSEQNQKLDQAAHASMERKGTVSTLHAAGKIPRVLEATKRLATFKRCPPPTKFYTGRQAENTQVITCITGGKNERRICVVYGLGGVGKTQLVLYAIENTRSEWDHIIYIDASSTESIEKALREFGEAKTIGETYQDVIIWLEAGAASWLMVFDNADTASTNIRLYIPVRGPRGSVLITTRLPDLASLAEGPESVCHLSGMSPADGTSLLVKIASSRSQHISEDDEKAAEQLDVGYLALAIVHASAYIAHSPSMTITKYRSVFLSQRRRMLEEYSKLPITAKLDERGDTVYTTWRMCYDQLKSESRELLWLVAYLHYDGIFEEMFRRAAQYMHLQEYPLPRTDLESQARTHVTQYLSTFLDSDGNWDTIKFAEVMADLTSFSLIDYDQVNLTYRVHVLVHDWARIVVPQPPELAVECTATLLSLCVDCRTDTESLAFKRQLGPHVTSVLTHNPNVGPNHVHYLKDVYHCTGQWSQAVKLLQLVVRAFEQELGEEHLLTLSCMGNLAGTYSNLGQHNKADQLNVQVLDAYKRVLGEEHPDTLMSMSNLALNYSYLGRHNDAEQLGAKVLDARKRILADDHPDTLTSMNNLALTYSHLGQHDKAEQLNVQVLDAHKRVLGEEHPQTLVSMSNLASTYSNLGRYIDAEQLALKVLDIRKRTLGDKHPSTLTSMNNLALAYSNLGRHNDAEQLNLEVINTIKQILGDEHPSTLLSMNNLAMTYSDLGRHNDAEQLKVQVLDTRKRVLGEEHPDTLESMNNLALTYSHLGRHDDAEQLNVQALDAHKRVLGEEHPHTLTSMNNLAMTYSNLGRHSDAEQLKLKVLDARKRVLGDEHPSTLTSMNNLASTYSDLGQHADAEQLEVKVLDAHIRVLGDEHPHTLVSMNNLASIYSHLRQHNNAERLKVQVLDTRKRVLGEEHPDTLLSMSSLASTYSDLGRHNDAEQLKVQALNAYKRVLGEEHPHTLLSISSLASTYFDLGRHNDAEQLNLMVLDAYKRILGDEHPYTLMSICNLAQTYSVLGQSAKAAALFEEAKSIVERTRGKQHPHT
ncbi:kinesin light chain [Rhizoctonia solani AG-3 Rhs1AP]|uniref:Kinesin light chain n=1 Tax=Rhizoctonia solani AG-3 Rhs1AP TaxID=1086054 RepID=X8J6I7_9AGAM|nr:kinesin light chain [Rhizoctonia solani AG-3 Rhs1AP]